MAPKGDNWDKAKEFWLSLKSDDNAKFDRIEKLQAEEIIPSVTWGTSPQDVLPINSRVPTPDNFKDEDKKKSVSLTMKQIKLINLSNLKLLKYLQRTDNY